MAKENWKETAWNGIRFRSPAQWEIAVLKNRYILMENPSGPVFEVRWAPIRGSFSLGRHLKKIEKEMKRADKSIRFRKTALPDELKTAPDRFETAGFSWESGTDRGRGALLFCPVCKTASLVQVRGRETSAETSSAVLEGFRDHQDDGYQNWAVYDIRARIPEPYGLAEFRFEMGRFKLVFQRKIQRKFGRKTGHSGERIFLYRWGPASVLLENKTMAEFASEIVGLPPDKADDTGENACEFRTDPSPARRFFFREPHARWRFRRDAAKNRILCVAVIGKNRANEEMLEDICRHYEAI